MPSKHSQDVLQAQARHVLYEIQMLSALATGLRTGELVEIVAGMPLDGVHIMNAAIEAFELHARNLIEFLIHQRGPRTATAGGYTLRRWKTPTEASKLRRLRKEFSERVAHLSWERSAKNEGQIVATEEIFETISANLRIFLEQADANLLSDGFIGQAHFALDGFDSRKPEAQVRPTIATASTSMPQFGRVPTQGLPPHPID
jgi:hypothetical protein